MKKISKKITKQPCPCNINGKSGWEAAKKRLTDITVVLPLALEEAWKDKEVDNAATDKSAAADAAQNTMQEA